MLILRELSLEQHEITVECFIGPGSRFSLGVGEVWWGHRCFLPSQQPLNAGAGDLVEKFFAFISSQVMLIRNRSNYREAHKVVDAGHPAKRTIRKLVTLKFINLLFFTVKKTFTSRSRVLALYSCKNHQTTPRCCCLILSLFKSFFPIHFKSDWIDENPARTNTNEAAS